MVYQVRTTYVVEGGAVGGWSRVLWGSLDLRIGLMDTYNIRI